MTGKDSAVLSMPAVIPCHVDLHGQRKVFVPLSYYPSSYLSNIQEAVPIKSCEANIILISAQNRFLSYNPHPVQECKTVMRRCSTFLFLCTFENEAFVTCEETLHYLRDLRTC